MLSPEAHARLVDNIDAVAQRAGLGEQHKHLIWTKAELDEGSSAWVNEVIRTVRRGEPWEKRNIGLCLTSDQHEAEAWMLSMTGLLVRNFVDARCLSLTQILVERKATGDVEGSAILCPDFVMPEYLNSLTAWDQKEMAGFLHDRVRMLAPTCLFVGTGPDIVKTKLPSVAEDLRAMFAMEDA